MRLYEGEHSGETLPYLPILVENIHSYVDRIFETLLGKFNEKQNIKSIDEAFLDIRFDHEAHMRILEKFDKERCTMDTYKKFLYGDSN